MNTNRSNPPQINQVEINGILGEQLEIKNTNHLTDHRAYKCKACQKGNPKNCTELTTYHIRVREKYAILWPIIGIICEIIFICLIIIIYEWNGPGYSNSREEICEEGTTVNLNGGPHRGLDRGVAEGCLAHPEFEDSEKRTERDNLSHPAPLN